MFIHALNRVSNFSAVNTQLQVNRNNYVSAQGLQRDAFVKTNQVSFKGAEVKKNNGELIGDLAAIGIVGGTFLLSLYGSAKLMAAASPNKIFLSGETYLMDTDEMRIETPEIIADADNGIFKVAGTPIDIDVNKYKYDVVDYEEGIFKNNDGSVDIDLKNNKYIDIEKGIVVDPERKVSFIMVDGEIHEIVVPSFGSGTPPWNPGGGCPSYSPPPRPTKIYDYHRQAPSREEFAASHDGKTPEEYYHMVSEEKFPSVTGYGKVKPNDYRSLFQKMKDYFEDSQSPDTYEKSYLYDVFGRRIVKVPDHLGRIHNLTLNDEMADLFYEKHIDNDTIIKIAQFMNNNRIQNYITDKCPDYSLFIPAKCQTAEEFIEALKSTGDGSTVVDVMIEQSGPKTDSLMQKIIDLFDQSSGN